MFRLHGRTALELASYGAAQREVLPSMEHRQHRYLTKRAENSHQPTRQRERCIGRFKSPGYGQRFLAAYSPIASHFRPNRHRLPARAYRQEIPPRCQNWRDIMATAMAASGQERCHPPTSIPGNRFRMGECGSAADQGNSHG
jgi:hypothetical protein